jgi:hypothetical protein
MVPPMSASPASLPRPSGQSPITTLRSLLEQRRAKGERFHLGEVVSILVPICTDLAARHAKGEALYIHPGAIGAGPDGKARIVPDLARKRPSDPRDLAAIAPELATSAPTTKSSVFAMGAIVYEMLTMQQVGPGMKPPTQLVPGLPPIVDTILAKALVTEIAQRPDDLAAFAQAIHHFAPNSIAPPPMADEHAFEVEVDLRSSMLPPAEVDLAAPRIPQAKAPVISHVADDPLAAIAAPTPQRSSDPFGDVIDARSSQPSSPERISQNRQTEELAALKARLEADPAPRWMMVKDKMDHGPFAAIELLQMIASDRFAPDDVLVDTHDNTRTPLKEHPEFSRFAHHANLRREQVKETKEVAKAEQMEKATGAAKGTFAIIAVVAALVVVGLVAWRIKGKADEEARRKAEEAMSLQGEGNVKGQEAAKNKPKYAGGGGGGGFNGKSYDEALKNSVSDNDSEGISMAECGAVGGGIAASCGLNGKATAKFMVQGGKVKGVSVSTDPSQPGVESCMRSAIGGMSFRNMPAATGCIRTFKTN